MFSGRPGIRGTEEACLHAHSVVAASSYVVAREPIARSSFTLAGDRIFSLSRVGLPRVQGCCRRRTGSDVFFPELVRRISSHFDIAGPSEAFPHLTTFGDSEGTSFNAYHAVVPYLSLVGFGLQASDRAYLLCLVGMRA